MEKHKGQTEETPSKNCLNARENFRCEAVSAVAHILTKTSTTLLQSKRKKQKNFH